MPNAPTVSRPVMTPTAASTMGSAAIDTSAISNQMTETSTVAAGNAQANPSTESEKESYLDIPAFLRKQAD